MMKKLFILGCIIFLVFCAPKKTTVKTEGLEEVVVFGEEKNVSEEPVYPTPAPALPETTPAPVVAEETPPPVVVPETPPPTVEEEIVPPLPVTEEPLTTPTPPPITPVPKEEISAPITPAPKPPTVPASVYGFRVQIFASSTQKGANKVAEDARSLFGGKVYIEHTPPYYKVRVGDCLTKEEAEALKNFAISKGFRGAFIVETMINP